MAKKSPLRTAGKCIGIIIGIIIVAFAALIGVLTLTEFNPAQTEDVEIQNTGTKTLSKGSSIDVLTWNTGYCGLSETADFFMDGGTGVRTVDEAGVKDNLANIQNLLTEFMRSESARGNYVIAGGDFNQGFSSLDTTKYPVQSEDLWQCGLVDVSKFGSGFSFCMDTATPTCRSLDRAYDPNDPTFQYYMIDGFIVSKNLNIESLETMSTGFDYSDHNPVKITVTLK